MMWKKRWARENGDLGRVEGIWRGALGVERGFFGDVSRCRAEVIRWRDVIIHIRNGMNGIIKGIKYTVMTGE
jgi:hypothetical protein